MSTPIPNSRNLAEDIVHAVEGCTCFDCRDKAEEIIARALMAEREACAMVALDFPYEVYGIGTAIASAIRDRSKS